MLNHYLSRVDVNPLAPKSMGDLILMFNKSKSNSDESQQEHLRNSMVIVSMDELIKLQNFPKVIIGTTEIRDHDQIGDVDITKGIDDFSLAELQNVCGQLYKRNQAQANEIISINERNARRTSCLNDMTLRMKGLKETQAALLESEKENKKLIIENQHLLLEVQSNKRWKTETDGKLHSAREEKKKLSKENKKLKKLDSDSSTDNTPVSVAEITNTTIVDISSQQIITNLESEINTMKTKQITLKSTIQTLKQTNTNLSTQINTLASVNVTLQTENKTLQSQLRKFTISALELSVDNVMTVVHNNNTSDIVTNESTGGSGDVVVEQGSGASSGTADTATESTKHNTNTNTESTNDDIIKVKASNNVVNDIDLMYVTSTSNTNITNHTNITNSTNNSNNSAPDLLSLDNDTLLSDHQASTDFDCLNNKTSSTNSVVIGFDAVANRGGGGVNLLGLQDDFDIFTTSSNSAPSSNATSANSLDALLQSNFVSKAAFTALLRRVEQLEEQPQQTN